MIKTHIRNSLIASLVVIFSITCVALPGVAFAADPPPQSAAKSEACEAIGGCNADAAGEVSNVLADVINILSAIVGVVAVIMVIVGGFRYITSAGDSTKAASARNTIVYALVGLVIVALAQVIVQFVLENAT